MVLQSVTIYNDIELPIRDQAGERLCFVLGTNTFQHNGRTYTYGADERPKWHAHAIAARQGVEMECFWLAGTMRLKVVCDGKAVCSARLKIERCKSSATKEEEEDDSESFSSDSGPPTPTC